MSMYNGSNPDVNNEVQLPLRGRPITHHEEEKTLNTFPRNIHGEETEYMPSDDGSGYGGQPPAHQVALNAYQSRTLRLAISVAAVSILLAVSMSAYSIVKYKEAVRELKFARENRGKVCMPCKDQKIQLDSWKEKNEAGECCVELQEVLSQVHQIAKDQASIQIKKAEALSQAQFSSAGSSRGNGKVRRISAHIVYSGDPPKWRTDSTQGHISEDLHLNSQGHLSVQTTGFYFVYSQLSATSNKSLNIATFTHEIQLRRFKGAEPVAVLSSRNMQWKSSLERTYSQQTSYVGGILFIAAEGSIYVSNGPNSDILPNPLKSCQFNDCFFGLYKL